MYTYFILRAGNICSESQPTSRPVKSALVGIWQKSRDLFEMLYGTHKSRKIVTDSIRRRKSFESSSKKAQQECIREVDSWGNENKSPKEEEKEKSFPQNLISMFFIAGFPLHVGSTLLPARWLEKRARNENKEEEKCCHWAKNKSNIYHRGSRLGLRFNTQFVVFSLPTLLDKYCVFAYNVA